MPLAAPHVAAELAPAGIARDPGDVGCLGEDEQLVVEAVGVKASRHLEHRPPPLAGRELGDGLLQLCVNDRKRRAHRASPPRRLTRGLAERRIATDAVSVPRHATSPEARRRDVFA